MNSMKESEKYIAQILFKLLDKEAADSHELVIANFEHGEPKKRGVSGIAPSQSAISQLLQTHIKRLATMFASSVGDNEENSFDQRTNKGFSVSILARERALVVSEKQVPALLNGNFIEKSFKRAQTFVLDEKIDVDVMRIAAILNDINIAIALEEDMKNKSKAYGYKGIFS